MEQKLTDRVAVLAGPGILMFQEVNNWGGGVRTNTVRFHISNDGSLEKDDIGLTAVRGRMTAYKNDGIVQSLQE